MLRGECPQELRRLLFGGSLIGLSKRTGGLRLIVISYVWRRLSAKCANKYAVNKLAPLFAPLQVGIATPGGGEAAVHAARSFVTDMTQEQIFTKLCKRIQHHAQKCHASGYQLGYALLSSNNDTIPELYAFAHQSYSAESILQFGELEIRSQICAQQRDPVVPYSSVCHYSQSCIPWRPSSA